MTTKILHCRWMQRRDVREWSERVDDWKVFDFRHSHERAYGIRDPLHIAANLWIGGGKAGRDCPGLKNS